MARKVVQASPIRAAIAGATENHKWKESTDAERFPGNKRVCQLETNDEGRFASALFIRLMDNAGAGPAILSRFHHYYYTPSRLKEKYVGCDVSIGHYESESRILLMYKLVSNHWCDQFWDWSSEPTRQDKNGGRIQSADQSNAKKLVQRSKRNPKLHPFILINVCFCVHEYRRMEAGINGVAIPGLMSPLRTTIIDLKNLADKNADWHTDVESEQFGIYVSRTPHEPYVVGMDPMTYLNNLATQGVVKVRVEPSGFEATDLAMDFAQFQEKATMLWNSDWSQR